MRASWPPERDARLAELWARGFSCTKVALILGDGLSRNAVIGRIHRLNIQRQRSHLSPLPETPVEAAPPPPAPKPAPPPERPPAAACAAPVRKPANAPSALAMRRAEQRRAPSIGPVTIFDLVDSSCRWIEGPVIGADTLYCGAARAHSAPYCARHLARTLGPGTPSERRAAADITKKLQRTGVWA